MNNQKPNKMKSDLSELYLHQKKVLEQSPKMLANYMTVSILCGAIAIASLIAFNVSDKESVKKASRTTGLISTVLCVMGLGSSLGNLSQTRRLRRNQNRIINNIIYWDNMSDEERKKVYHRILEEGQFIGCSLSKKIRQRERD